MFQRKKKGFSLVEMLVVIAIIAVLVAIVTPMIVTSTVKAAAATNAANLRAAKGAFTTLKLMYPEDYTSWTSNLTSLTGITAVNEQFVVSGNIADNMKDETSLQANENAPALMASDDGALTVAAPDAVELKLPDYGQMTAKGDPMNAQILNNYEDGTQEVYVTYNGLPIAFFAEVAEKGTANPEDYRNKGAGNVLANQAYIDRYMGRLDQVGNDVNMDKLYGFLGDRLGKQVQELINDPASQGDCLECAVNKLDFTSSGNGLLWIPTNSEFTSLGQRIENMLTSKGYDKTEGGRCPGYKPTSATDVSCANCYPGHGPEAHISQTGMVDVGKGFEDEACPKGGYHTYEPLNQDHICTKCGQSNGKACPTVDSAVPYIGSLIQDSCIYCGFCECCAYGNYHRVGDKLGDALGDFTDLDVCISADPILGGGALGCGHPASQHRNADGTINQHVCTPSKEDPDKCEKCDRYLRHDCKGDADSSWNCIICGEMVLHDCEGDASTQWRCACGAEINHTCIGIGDTYRCACGKLDHDYVFSFRGCQICGRSMLNHN